MQCDNVLKTARSACGSCGTSLQERNEFWGRSQTAGGGGGGGDLDEMKYDVDYRLESEIPNMPPCDCG